MPIVLQDSFAKQEEYVETVEMFINTVQHAVEDIKQMFFVINARMATAQQDKKDVFVVVVLFAQMVNSAQINIVKIVSRLYHTVCNAKHKMDLYQLPNVFNAATEPC